jgi:hypothetical protein
MERAKGFEPSVPNPQGIDNKDISETVGTGCTQIRAQIQGDNSRDSPRIVKAWDKLPAACKAASLAIVDSNGGKRP